MSWLERIQNEIRIITGDGKEYNPVWRGAEEFDQAFNLSSFEFIGVEGTFVRRKKIKGRSFGFQIWFQGEDHLDESEEFRQSCADERPWRIISPYDGEILVHPETLKFDRTAFNITKITGTLLETITGLFPEAQPSTVELIIERKGSLDLAIETEFNAEVPTIDGTDAAVINQNIEDIGQTTESITSLSEQVAEIRNFVNRAVSAVTNAIGDVAQFIVEVQNVVNYPFQVIATVRERINSLRETWDRLATSLTAIFGNGNTDKNQRKYLEAQGATAVSSACVAAVNQLEDFPYGTTKDVTDVITDVVDFYNSYVDVLEQTQSANSTDPNATVASEEVQRLLEELVSLTVSRLFDIAFGNRTEITLVLEFDDNLINIAHRIYGLEPSDERLNEFLTSNNIGRDELLLIKKGREIVYYV